MQKKCFVYNYMKNNIFQNINSCFHILRQLCNDFFAGNELSDWISNPEWSSLYSFHSATTFEKRIDLFDLPPSQIWHEIIL